RNALPQLRQSRPHQPLFQFRLAGQHNLQQFSVRGLEVREQANGFQHRVGEILGLVDEKHDALPGFRFAKQEIVQVRVHTHDVAILAVETKVFHQIAKQFPGIALRLKKKGAVDVALPRSEEHTSELQSRGHLVCRLLLEKKKTNQTI